MGSSGELRVGRATVAFGEALDWASTYLDVGRNCRDLDEPYAYPAYDRFDDEHNDPDRLSDADLLAPVLLNVSISIRSFYALQAIREPLQLALRGIGSLSRSS